MIFRIVQIDEIGIVVVAIGSCNGPNRQRTSLAAKTGKDFLLLRNIPDDIGTFVRRMVNFATSKAPAIQFCHCAYTQSLQVSYINTVNLPKVSPWMLDIFRQHDLVGNGMELGARLNPFSVICSGHHNTKDVLVLAKRQATVEAGATVALSDTLEFKTKDAHFPKTYLQASDKLWAFCLLCRVYFGARHVLYTALFDSMEIVCPLIQNLECVFASSKKEGLLIAIRAMLAYQSKVQAWLRLARSTAVTTVVAAPDFSRILEAVQIT